MRIGYKAVVVPATVAEVSSLLSDDRPGSHVLELMRNVVALETAAGQQDSAAYHALATKAAERYGSAVLVACLLSYPYQSAHVFRRGQPPALYVLPSTGPSDSESQHFAGLDPSFVALPLVEALDLAGLPGRELAAELCKRLGKHEHA